jgi:hypothetical protein
MKTAYNCFEKGRGTHKKKKKIVFKNKIEIGVPNINFFGGAHEFCFTNMKIVLQKCVPNKLITPLFSLTSFNLFKNSILFLSP